MLVDMKKYVTLTQRRKARRRPAARLTPPVPAALPLGTQQALMGLAAFQAQRP
jgi:hypothetical protein